MFPLRYSFQPVASCRFMDPAPKIDGSFTDWSRERLLPDWFPDDAHPPFATFYTGWDGSHLFFAAQVNLRRTPRVLPFRFWEGDCVELFLDLRGTFAPQYTEHCAHFFILPAGAGNPRAHGGRCEPGVANQIAVPEDTSLRIGSETFAQGYRLEIALPREAIPTFDPERYPHIGFNYLIHDATGRIQFWSAGPDVHTYRDPSTWGVLHLEP